MLFVANGLPPLPKTAGHRVKIAVLVYQALHQLLPPYLSDLCLSAGQLHHHDLRSVAHHDLASSRTATMLYGNRTFQHSATAVWNNIPLAVRSATSIDQFRSQLKTVLFARSYNRSAQRFVNDVRDRSLKKIED